MRPQEDVYAEAFQTDKRAGARRLRNMEKFEYEAQGSLGQPRFCQFLLVSYLLSVSKRIHCSEKMIQHKK